MISRAIVHNFDFALNFRVLYGKVRYSNTEGIWKLDTKKQNHLNIEHFSIRYSNGPLLRCLVPWCRSSELLTGIFFTIWLLDWYLDHNPINRPLMDLWYFWWLGHRMDRADGLLFGTLLYVWYVLRPLFTWLVSGLYTVISVTRLGNLVALWKTFQSLWQ